MAVVRGIFFLIFLSVLFALGLWGCGKAKLGKIEVSPDKEELLVGESVHFKARGFSDKGDEMPDLEFQWSLDSDIGTIDQSGRFKAEKPGQAIITAYAHGLKGTANVNVTPVQVADETAQKESVEFEAVDDTAPETMEIYSTAFEKHKRGPVKLSHLKHSAEYNVACIDCHHDYQDGINMWTPSNPVQSCASCHDPEETKGEVKKLQTAYHTNCKNCHREMVEAEKSEDAPYKTCSGCHEKKE